ncbi:hypothetical protein EON82_26335, partial [bacterium]
MAAETSEPKSGIVLQIAALSIVVLVGARYGLVSYFNTQMGDEYDRKVGTYRSATLDKLRETETKALTS